MRSNAILLPSFVLTASPLSLCDSPTCRNCGSGDAIVTWVKRSDRNVPPIGFGIPAENGGSLLTKVPITYPAGQGEPLNIIISGYSDSRVLVDSPDNGGLQNYFQSIGFSGECLGQRESIHQAADLGDGDGFKNETAVIRWAYGDPQLGTCKETIQGGNHFRYWIQDGPQLNSGAIFMAASYEKPIAEQHDIIPNGYNLGRDWLVGNITQSPVPTLNITNGTTYSGTTSSEGYTYNTDILYMSGLLENTNYGINHNYSVGVNGINSVDGFVAILDVTITQVPPQTSTAWHPLPFSLWHSICYLLLVSFISLALLP